MKVPESPPRSHEDVLYNLKSEALPPTLPLSLLVILGMTFSRFRCWGSPASRKFRHPDSASMPASRGPGATERGRCSGRLPGRCGKGWAAAPSPRGDSSRPLPLPPPSRAAAAAVRRRARPASESTSRPGPGPGPGSGRLVDAPGCAR